MSLENHKENPLSETEKLNLTKFFESFLSSGEYVPHIRYENLLRQRGVDMDDERVKKLWNDQENLYIAFFA